MEQPQIDLENNDEFVEYYKFDENDEQYETQEESDEYLQIIASDYQSLT